MDAKTPLTDKESKGSPAIKESAPVKVKEKTQADLLKEQGFREYARTGSTFMKPYRPGMNLAGVQGLPHPNRMHGGMIAVDVNNPSDMWFVSKELYDNTYSKKPKE